MHDSPSSAPLISEKISTMSLMSKKEKKKKESPFISLTILPANHLR